MQNMQWERRKKNNTKRSVYIGMRFEVFFFKKNKNEKHLENKSFKKESKKRGN